MIFKKTKISKNLIIGVVFSLLLTTQVQAVDSSADPYVDGKLSLVQCLKKGKFDFLLFLRASVWNDNLMEGLIEPWKDIIMRNQCQSTDIIGLIKQQDSIRKSIRDSFLTCKTQKLSHLRTLYYEMTAETYYVRHVVKGGVVLGLPYDVNTRVFGAASETNRDQLYTEMQSRYAKNDVIPSDKFDNFFLKIESKYADRKQSYIDCGSGSWQLVKEKWDEFVKSGAGAGDAIKSAGKNIAADGKNLGKEFSEMATVQLINGEKGWLDYVGSFVEVNLNGLGIKEGVSDIAESLSKNLPSFGNFNQSALISELSFSEKQFEMDTMKSEMMTNFASLYGVAGDETLEIFLNTLDGRQIKEDGLIEILEQSYGPLNTVLERTSTMLDRQCPS